ncbi:MAG: hypothetical protein ACYC9Q_03325 [Bacillota bacterium]
MGDQVVRKTPKTAETKAPRPASCPNRLWRPVLRAADTRMTASTGSQARLAARALALMAGMAGRRSRTMAWTTRDIRNMTMIPGMTKSKNPRSVMKATRTEVPMTVQTKGTPLRMASCHLNGSLCHCMSKRLITAAFSRAARTAPTMTTTMMELTKAPV